jgi:hypothetical protein
MALAMLLLGDAGSWSIFSALKAVSGCPCKARGYIKSPCAWLSGRNGLFFACTAKIVANRRNKPSDNQEERKW